jgi:protein SSD1
MRLNDPPQVSDSSVTLVKFAEWPDNEQYPLSNLIRLLGVEGSFSVEDDASLEMVGLISDKYDTSMDKILREMFPSADKVIETELPMRRDVRKTERVFTIDPPTAKDLDDAADPNIFRIGVHVADVSYFVSPNSVFDKEAIRRGTSVYLPRQVYPMLPPYLSENLCSLLPKADRLAFSVYYTIDMETGELVGEPEFIKSIIRSVAQLSYDDVDAAFRGSNHDKKIPESIFNDLKLLMKLTNRLRENRIISGSVSIDDRNSSDLKFDFHLDDRDNQHPVGIVGCSPTTAMAHDSHTLIEELMVMTNKIVAEKLVNSPGIVPVVRRHLDTESAVVESARKFLSRVNVHLPERDIELAELLLIAKTRLSPILYSTFTHSILGDFSRAEYIVTSPDGCDGSSHWGVGARRYMHFTSPIRRYADLIVHRKLTSLLLGEVGNDSEENMDELVSRIRKCNTAARAAKEAENNNKLFYFSTFVRSFGSAGYPVDVVVKSLIPPQDHKAIKGSISFYVPLIGDVKSQSLESFGLELVDVVRESGEDTTVTSLRVRNSRTKEICEIRLFEQLKMIAYTRREMTAIPKFYLRFLNSIPIPPRQRKGKKIS